MDNRYHKQFTTNAVKNDNSLNATTLAVLLLRDAPRYWHSHRNLQELEMCVARILRDSGFANACPVVRNIKAPLDVELFLMYLLRDCIGELFP